MAGVGNNGTAANKRSLPDEADISDHQPATTKRRNDDSAQPKVSSSQEESSALKSILTGNGADDETAISSFFETTWQVEPQVYRRNKTEDASCPLTRAVDLGWDGLASLLERSRKRFDGLNNTDDASPTAAAAAAADASPTAAGTLDPPLFFRDQTPVQFPEVQSMYNANPFAAYLDGCSVVLNHADQLCPRLAALCEDLQQSFPHCYCNGYLTPPGAQAVPPHADDRDVFVVQLLGEKVWKVYKHVPIAYPYPHEQVGKGGLDVPPEILVGATVIETTLRKGDLLYMPRGWVHEARTESNQPSFHATVAIATHDWTLAGNMTEIISRTLASNESLRLAVDRRVGNASSEGTELSAASGGSESDLLSLQAQIDTAIEEIRKQVTAKQIERQLGIKYAAQRKMCRGARMTLIGNDQTGQTTSEGKNEAVVGPEASRRVFTGTTVRAATDEERASVRPPPCPAGAADAASDRGLTVREETSLALMTIVQCLKQDRSLKVKVSDMRSLVADSNVDESGTEMVCTLSIMAFIRAAVELGAVAVV